jgi:hypothetical protein
MAKTKLISTEPSRCCSNDAQIVLSRKGGLIARVCLKCGESDYVNEDQLPKPSCNACRISMQIKKLDGTNYCYTCPQCGEYDKIADVAPIWSKEFRYSGLAAHGDSCLAL